MHLSNDSYIFIYNSIDTKCDYIKHQLSSHLQKRENKTNKKYEQTTSKIQ